MQTANLQLYSLSYSESKTYWATLVFVVGNLLLPQLFHLLPQGGMIWLPIYFFTLVGSYKYGWRVGLLTAILSPMTNSFLFGMPSVTVLPAILLKSVLLAVAAGYAASHFKKVTFGLLLGVVLGYQLVGTLGEWALQGNLWLALQDFRLGIPGMLLQIFGGWLFIHYLIRKK